LIPIPPAIGVFGTAAPGRTIHGVVALLVQTFPPAPGTQVVLFPARSIAPDNAAEFVEMTVLPLVVVRVIPVPAAEDGRTNLPGLTSTIPAEPRVRVWLAN